MTIELRAERPSPARLVLHLNGRLDAVTYLDFDTTVLPMMGELPQGVTVVLDLAGLDYISSAGLRSVARVRKATRALHGHTLLLDPQPQVRKVFDIVKAVPVSEVFASTAELDAYLDRIQQRMIEGNGE
ncbi:STAS domain-containing protein [Dyella sp. A6]|uniref:STAS domain-containing protein n=1 Tax=Dyella aluminiiresistens TaxID=3069105 RepID=UPI002E7A7F98|nr:STAS domain-containing protein [Dyella sp. A6]